MSDRTKYLIGALMVFGAAFGFALKGIFIKSAYRYGIDSITLLALRFLFSAPFYLVTIFRTRVTEVAHPVIPLKIWCQVVLIGFTGYYVSAYVNFLGLEYISASLERILLFIYPTFVLLINSFLVKRKVSRLQWLALVITYAGIIVAFNRHFQAHQQKNIALGAFLVILSGLTYSFYLVGSDKLIGKLGTTRFTSWAMLSALVPTLIHSYIYNGLDIFGFPAPVYLISIAMAIFSTVLPTFLFSAGIKRVGSGNASIIASIGPIFTIILATAFLNEPVWLEQIIGTALVLAGVFLISWKGKK
ncbi:DMT family transporter [Emticicia sp. TH156]|uniref:DMT family transporter n=1 Tax=Emticicia sp. TH156 TaxID=2067454 RepID=UPI000C794B15|nr:DMT family transporter [Emticicia sp. TH156]PLK45970.1 EamA/RhaT family transporter [Emticicia sp. TH156]